MMLRSQSLRLVNISLVNRKSGGKKPTNNKKVLENFTGDINRHEVTEFWDIFASGKIEVGLVELKTPEKNECNSRKPRINCVLFCVVMPAGIAGVSFGW